MKCSAAAVAKNSARAPTIRTTSWRRAGSTTFSSRARPGASGASTEAAAVASATSGSVAYMAFLLAVDTRRRGREWLTVPERAVSRAFICRSARSAVLFSVDLHRPARLLAVAVVLACAAAAAAHHDHARARAGREAGEILTPHGGLGRVQRAGQSTPVE